MEKQRTYTSQNLTLEQSKAQNLVPVLYPIFASPIFDLHKMSNYADGNFIIRRNRCIKDLIVDIQTSLVAIIKWLQHSGRQVNESKTEVCLLHCNETRMKMINVNYNLFTSIPQINVAGVTMDSKMQWNNQTQLKKQIKPS